MNDMEKARPEILPLPEAITRPDQPKKARPEVPVQAVTQWPDMPAELRHALGIDFGQINVSYGFHEIKVTTEPPNFVWFDVKGNGGTGCGQSPVNQVGWSREHDGFVMAINCETDTATIYWFASRHELPDMA